VKRIRYIVAMSVDGYIAGPKGEYDWITMDPEVDFAALWAQFDTLIMGRRTYEVARPRLGDKAFKGLNVAVVSRTMKPADNPGVVLISDLTRARVQELRDQAAKDIWLMGGGDLFRTLLEMHEVDAVEVSAIPVLLGGGVKLLAGPTARAKLKLTDQKVYRSGRVSLVYDVEK